MKRIPLLIRAYARAKPRFEMRAPLVLLGGYPGEWEGEHPLEVIEDEGVEDVFLAGWRGHKDLPRGLNAADVVVLPSVREQFGQVLVEGMACGLPVIAKDAYGPAEIVDHGETGWLVPPDDEEALADALVDAVNDPGKRARKGEAAYVVSHDRYAWPVARRERRRGLRAGPLRALRCASVSAIPYTIRRSDRARRARIVVDDDGVEVVVPRRMALRHVEPFVAEKQRWIERTLERYEAARREAPRPVLADGGSVPYLGERLELDVRVEPGRTRPHVARRDEWLTVKVARRRRRDAVADALERWYRKRAREEIEPRLDCRDRPRRHELDAAVDPGPAHALGELLAGRRDELQLAPAARAGRDPRLRRRARGRAPRGARPLAALSGACSAVESRTTASTSAGSRPTATRLDAYLTLSSWDMSPGCSVQKRP